MSKDPKSNYYDSGGIEVIEIIKAKLSPEEFRGYLRGNAIKYLSRITHKEKNNPLADSRDAEKAQYYVKWLNESIQDEINEQGGIQIMTTPFEMLEK